MNEKHLLMATYHGEQEYYVCASNWEMQMAHGMCYYLTGRCAVKSTFILAIKSNNYLILNKILFNYKLNF